MRKNVPINWHLLRKHMNVSWWYTMIYHVQPKEVLVGPIRKRNLANRASLRLLIETCTVLRSWTTMILMGRGWSHKPSRERSSICHQTGQGKSSTESFKLSRWYQDVFHQLYEHQNSNWFMMSISTALYTYSLNLPPQPVCNSHHQDYFICSRDLYKALLCHRQPGLGGG